MVRQVGQFLELPQEFDRRAYRPNRTAVTDPAARKGHLATEPWIECEQPSQLFETALCLSAL